MTAFGMTKRSGRSVSNDPGLQAVLASRADAICLVSKAWDYHVRVALGITNEENLKALEQSVKAITASGREAMIDCEHFFDGYKGNREYALAVARTAYEAGRALGRAVRHQRRHAAARGGAHRPRGVQVVPGTHLGIHTHNDTENAVANSLTAVRAGCRQIQGTLNGIGERCGNANLTSIIPTLLLKSEFADRFETQVTPDAAADADARQPRARRAAEPLARPACALRGRERVCDQGRHPRVRNPQGAGDLRARSARERRQPAPPARVRSRPASRRSSPRSSGSASRSRRTTRASRALLEEVKTREAVGYSYEAAEASFELLARRMLGEVPRYFTVDSFRVMVEKRHNARGKLVTVSEATVKVFINGDNEPLWSVGEGNGPVNALDLALRKDLGRYQKHIEGVELVDYKVRILTGGTEAVTRVLVESHDTVTGERWFTVGVSPNIIDASFEALINSINYKLMKDNAQAA